MGDNTIGRMAVEVGVDLTDLEAGFQQAVGDASVAGKAVADALSEAVSGNDLGEKIVQDLAPAQEAFTAWQTQIESLSLADPRSRRLWLQSPPRPLLSQRKSVPQVKPLNQPRNN
jgi:hypothetical protein